MGVIMKDESKYDSNDHGLAVRIIVALVILITIPTIWMAIMTLLAP